MITKDQCKKIREVEGTAGGTTYHITKKGEEKERAICFRRIRNKDENPDGLLRCENQAGSGTDHVGSGACKLHGGSAANSIVVGNAIVNGRYAQGTRSALATKIDNYLDTDADQMYSLTRELVSLKVIFKELVDTFPEYPTDPAMALNYSAAIGNIVGITDKIGKMVDTASKINSRNTLTAAQVLYLRATVVDIFVKYMKDPAQREMAVKELTSRIGGADMQEHSLVKREKWEKADE